MDYSKIPNDDLLDVVEMTTKLKKYMAGMLDQTEMCLAMSAVMNATIHCILSQCKTMDEVLFYRKTFMEFFDGSIRAIKLKDDSLGSPEV